MRELTIKRSEWLHTLEDLKAGESMLYRTEDGKKCCLGIYAEACGVPVSSFANFSQFNQTFRDADNCTVTLPAEMSWLLVNEPGRTGEASEDAKKLMSNNDDTRMLESEKERIIARYFSYHDVHVTFVD